MKLRSSLRFRLMAANILVKQIVILLAALYLLSVFDELMRRQTGAELKTRLAGVVAAVARADAEPARLDLKAIADSIGPAGNSFVWQIARGGEILARSPSLGTAAMLLPAGARLSDEPILFEVEAQPGTTELLSAGQTIETTGLGAAQSPGRSLLPVSIIVARKNSELAALHEEFRNAVIIALGAIAALLLTSAWMQVNIGLRPAELLRNNIERIRLGLARRLGDGFPDELRPLIEETNRLLEAQEKTIEMARARAGDLAHGLKTPLSAVTALAEQLHEAGDCSTAGEILKNVDLACRHVERELSRTRIAASSGLTYATPLHSVVSRLRETIERLPRGDELDWENFVPSDLLIKIDESDVVEICGSIFDNARKWASSQVQITARREGGEIILVVEDDGPGVSEGDYERILSRGMRLDESKPGNGLGLTIAKDIVQAYGGAIDLKRSRLGGLGVTARLPAAGLGEPHLPPSPSRGNHWSETGNPPAVGQDHITPRLY